MQESITEHHCSNHSFRSRKELCTEFVFINSFSNWSAKFEQNMANVWTLITSLLLGLKPNMKYWVGLQRSGNDWQWVDSSTSVYRNWANNVTPTTGCVIANAAGTAAGTWSAIDCTQRYAGNQGIICKTNVQTGQSTTTTSMAATSKWSFFKCFLITVVSCLSLTASKWQLCFKRL